MSMLNKDDINIEKSIQVSDFVFDTRHYLCVVAPIPQLKRLSTR